MSHMVPRGVNLVVQHSCILTPSHMFFTSEIWELDFWIQTNHEVPKSHQMLPYSCPADLRMTHVAKCMKSGAMVNHSWQFSASLQFLSLQTNSWPVLNRFFPVDPGNISFEEFSKTIDDMKGTTTTTTTPAVEGIMFWCGARASYCMCNHILKRNILQLLQRMNSDGCWPVLSRPRFSLELKMHVNSMMQSGSQKSCHHATPLFVCVWSRQSLFLPEQPNWMLKILMTWHSFCAVLATKCMLIGDNCPLKETRGRFQSCLPGIQLTECFVFSADRAVSPPPIITKVAKSKSSNSAVSAF